MRGGRTQAHASEGDMLPMAAMTHPKMRDFVAVSVISSSFLCRLRSKYTRVKPQGTMPASIFFSFFWHEDKKYGSVFHRIMERKQKNVVIETKKIFANRLPTTMSSKSCDLCYASTSHIMKKVQYHKDPTTVAWRCHVHTQNLPNTWPKQPTKESEERVTQLRKMLHSHVCPMLHSSMTISSTKSTDPTVQNAYTTRDICSPLCLSE